MCMLSVEEAQHLNVVRKNICPECGSHQHVWDSTTGETVCSRCGLVLYEKILDQKPEYRAFTPKERESRTMVGSPTSLRMYDKGLSTTFKPYYDASGQTLPINVQSRMKRLGKWNFRVHPSTQQNLYRAMSELSLLSDKLHIPIVVEETAALIYRKARKKGLIKGRTITGLIGASLYAACRLSQTPRRLNEIVEVSAQNRKEIARCYRLIQQNLNLTILPDDPLKYISQIASKLRISQKTQSLAIKLLREAAERKIVSGKNPAGLAAALLYSAARLNSEKIGQVQLAEVAKVTEVTVRNRYQELDNVLELGIS